jgi:hypothetical protein
MGTFRITVNGVVVAKRLWPFLSLKGWLCNVEPSFLFFVELTKRYSQGILTERDGSVQLAS